MPPARKPGPQGTASESAPPQQATKPVACVAGLGIDEVSRYVGKSVKDVCAFGYGKKSDPQNHCAHFVSHALNIQVGIVCTDLLPWNVKESSTDNLFRLGTRQVIAAGYFTGEGKNKTTFRGASTRVNEIYNSIAAGSKGLWDDRPMSKPNCLIYATLPGNVSNDHARMGEMPKKHIGIHKDGKIYHYGNTDDEVKGDTFEEFKRKFTLAYGKDVLFLWSAIPDVDNACVYRGSSIG
jgi:hypothetical protein